MAKDDDKKSNGEEADAETPEEGEEGGKKKLSGKSLILFIVLPALLVIGGGGAAAMMLLGGGDKAEVSEDGYADEKDDHGEKKDDSSKKGKDDKDKKGKDDKGKGGDYGDGDLVEGEFEVGSLIAGEDGDPSYYDMPDLIVNLAGDEDDRPLVLKLELVLESSHASTFNGVPTQIPRLQDQIQTFLRELRVEDLSGSAGTYRLRLELLKRFNRVLAPEKIDAVLIEGILIQ